MCSQTRADSVLLQGYTLSMKQVKLHKRGFLFAERKALEPVLPLDLFRNQIFSVGALLSLLQMMLLLGFSLYLPLFFQRVLAVSPTSAGLVMTPFSMSMVVGAVLSSMAVTRLKRYRV